MVIKSSILLGAAATDCARDLLNRQMITNWQDLSPAHVDAARILVFVQGDEQAYEQAIAQIAVAAAQRKVAWRHEEYTVYGDPRGQTWIPPLGSITGV
jgi:hypothetical protein